MSDHAGFDPSELFVYRGKGGIPRDVRRVEVDRSVRFIPHCVFKNCRQLESVTLHEGLLRIGRWAFHGCSSLGSIQIPSTVTEIGEGAFCGCSNLAAAELAEGLEAIERAAFAFCTSLEEVRIPTSVARIGVCAFEGCTNLALLDLREGLRIIGDAACRYCPLESLRVPSSVDEIGFCAFDSCSSLTLVRLLGHLPKMKRQAFRRCPLESFRFVRLSERMEAMRMDIQMKSMCDRRLSEISLALRRSHHDENTSEWNLEEDEEEAEAARENCKESLERAHEFLTYLELKGAVSVLELALWKGKIEGERGEGVQSQLVNNEDGGQDPSDEGRERKRPKVVKNIGQDNQLSRRDCRVKCGAGIVIPEVLKFFTFRSSWPRMDDSEEGNVD